MFGTSISFQHICQDKAVKALSAGRSAPDLARGRDFAAGPGFCPGGAALRNRYRLKWSITNSARDGSTTFDGSEVMWATPVLAISAGAVSTE
jgi:hypothetical protein